MKWRLDTIYTDWGILIKFWMLNDSDECDECDVFLCYVSLVCVCVFYLWTKEYYTLHVTRIVYNRLLKTKTKRTKSSRK